MTSSPVGQPVIVCTGYHRSATSAVARYLNSAGLNMGNHLMGADISNPGGHFEDWPVVKLHDAALLESGADWQYQGNEALLALPTDSIAGYVAVRDQGEKVWGFKDPRTMLYLDSWDKALGSRGHYLFVIRHWAECIESLLQRHSRPLAYNEFSRRSCRLHTAFWSQPDLAARMWLAYNRKLLEFLERQHSNRMVLTHRAVLAKHSLIASVNEKFNMALDATVDSPVNTKLVTASVADSIHDSLSESLRVQLDAIWQQLLEYADFQEKDENVRYYKDEKSDQLLLKQVQAFMPDAIDNKSTAATTAAGSIEDDFVNRLASAIGEDVFAELLKWATRKGLRAGCELGSHLVNHVDTHLPLVSKSYQALADYLFFSDLHSLALENYKHAVLINKPNGQLYASIGKCYLKLKDIKLAQYFFDKAIQFNPKNAMFYCHKALLLDDLGHREESVVLYQQALALAPTDKRIVKVVAAALEQMGNIEGALAAMAPIAERKEADVQKLYVKLLLASDVEAGKKAYFSMVSTALKSVNQAQFLAPLFAFVGSAAAEQDLLSRIEKHWQVLEQDYKQGQLQG